MGIWGHYVGLCGVIWGCCPTRCERGRYCPTTCGVLYEITGFYMGLWGYVWDYGIICVGDVRYVGLYGVIRDYMGWYGIIWGGMGLCGVVWDYVGWYGIIWDCVGLRGAIWDSMGRYGIIWGAMGRYEGYEILWGDSPPHPSSPRLALTSTGAVPIPAQFRPHPFQQRSIGVHTALTAHRGAQRSTGAVHPPTSPHPHPCPIPTCSAVPGAARCCGTRAAPAPC